MPCWCTGASAAGTVCETYGQFDRSSIFLSICGVHNVHTPPPNHVGDEDDADGDGDVDGGDAHDAMGFWVYTYFCYYYYYYFHLSNFSNSYQNVHMVFLIFFLIFIFG